MRKIKIAFLVAALSIMVTGIAFAIDIPNITTWTQSPGVGGGGPGRGDVLIGALYDVRNIIDPNLPEPFDTQAQGQQTLISIVNTDPIYGVVARLRFREWKRSHECLDIDIPLTSNDVWVAEISRMATGGPVLQTSDYMISNIPNPLSSANFLADPVDILFPAGIPFRPNQILQFEPSLSTAAALERCEYGYWELIGEERFLNINKTSRPYPLQRTIVRIPLPCGNPTFDCRDVQDMLLATAYIIRPDQAISHQYNTNALSDFAVTSAGIYQSPLTDRPNLRDDVQGETLPSDPLNPNLGVGGINQLEAILSKNFIFYQYVNGDVGGTPMSTSVVTTFPTKWFHYTNTAPTFFNINGTWPFWPPFTGYCEVTGDCTASTGGGEIVNVAVWDRDENTFSIPGQAPISPPDIITPGLPRLPYEVNVIGIDPNDPAQIAFRNNVAIATKNSTSGQEFNSGWGWIDLSPALGFVSIDPRTIRQGESGIIFNFYNNFFTQYYGLPAIGIVMTEFFNDLLEGYYGNTVPWQYAVDWN